MEIKKYKGIYIRYKKMVAPVNSAEYFEIVPTVLLHENQRFELTTRKYTYILIK